MKSNHNKSYLNLYDREDTRGITPGDVSVALPCPCSGLSVILTHRGEWALAEYIKYFFKCPLVIRNYSSS